MRGFFNFLSNVIWIILGGIWLFLAWCACGILLCVTIIGIPFGVQCFKIGWLSLAPFGKEVVTDYARHPVANVIWVIIGGWEMALAYLFIGIINCITIIGIPRGIQCFKIMKIALFPFGSTAVTVQNAKTVKAARRKAAKRASKATTKKTATKKRS